MNKILNKKILLGFMPIFAALAFAFPARAANIDVVFAPDPIFTQANFIPLDETSGVATVTNNSGLPQTILTEAINVSDDDNFGSLLHLKITGSSGTSFDDSLSEFFSTAGEVSLGEISNGESKAFTYTVSFINSANNDYQGKMLGFDICVGFEGGNTHCGDTVAGGEKDTDGGENGGGGSNPGTGNGGGNGPILPPSLVVSNEETSGINPDNGTAVIAWNTNLYSTSQVIYGPATTSPYILNLNTLPNFGYPMGTIETATKVLNHSVTLTGLIPGETYKYRAVSRASPPTISFEREFVMPGSGAFTITNNANGGDPENFQTMNNIAAAPQKQLAVNGKRIIASGENYSGGINSTGSVESGSIENINSEGNAGFQENISEKTPSNLAAAFLALGQWLGISKYILIFLFLAGMVWLFLFRKKNVA